MNNKRKKIKHGEVDPSQKRLTDSERKLNSFLDEEYRERKRHNVLAKQHFAEGFLHYLTSFSQNSSELELANAYFYRVVKRLEEKGCCYIKRTKDGKFKIFKKYYCKINLAAWRKCPESYCPAWKSPDATCPYNGHGENSQI